MKYMQVHLHELSKNAFYKHRSTCVIDVQRPCGFITTEDGVRKLYIHSMDNGKFYVGELMPYHTDEMFMQMNFTEVKEFVTAQFVTPDD